MTVAHLFPLSLLFQGFRDTEALPVAGSFPTEHLAWMRWIWGTCGVGRLTLTLWSSLSTLCTGWWRSSSYVASATSSSSNEWRIRSHFAVAGQMNVDGGHLIKCLILLFQCSYKIDEKWLRCFSYCVLIYSLGLSGFVQFIDITFSCCLISSAYLTCKQYCNALENKKSNNSGRA